jgi:hypothetical protein
MEGPVLSINDLWSNADPLPWRDALERYPAVVQAQEVARLLELDRWYRDELPELLKARQPAYVRAEELARATEWKMARGVWRHRNLLLVRSNDAGVVEEVSRAALAAVPDPLAPIRLLATLAGVGPATASAIAAAYAPQVYPFFDDLVAGQVPALGKVEFTLRYYARYAEALRDRAVQLGGDWTPSSVERALWSNAGGKAGVRR